MWPGDIGRHNGTTSAGAGDDDPFRQDIQVLGMQPYWGRMQAVTNGTDFIRYYAPTYLPQEPREPKDAYETRVQRSVLSPYTVRLIDNAAGLILRRPINIEGDDFWTTWSENVDGLGSSLNEYARRALVSSLCYGHSGILVDFPPDPGVTTLFEERQLGRRPYFNHVDAYQIWGWRQESAIPNSPLTQIRLHEFATVPEGKFGQTRVERMRVIYPEKYEVYQRNGEVYGDTSPVGTQEIGLIETGELPFNQIPFVPIYTNRTGMLTSSPPLIDIANLNITHYQRQADLIHALHIAAMPILVMEGWDDADDSTAVGVNYGMITTPGNKVYYVNADAGAFSAQQEETKRTRNADVNPRHLQAPRPKVRRRIRRRKTHRPSPSQLRPLHHLRWNWSPHSSKPTNSPPATSESKPPKSPWIATSISTSLLGQDISVIGQLRAEGALSNETYLDILKSGEIIPDKVDLTAELEPREQITRREESTKQSSNLKCNKKRRKTRGNQPAEPAGAPEN